MRRWLGTALIAAMAGCASEVPRSPATLSEGTATAEVLTLAGTLSIKLSTHYDRTVPAGTRLAAFGGIAQGMVLRPVAYTFTIEGAHVHEAYFVARDGYLVGFYLPVERAFSPLPQPVRIQLNKEGGTK